MTLPLARMPAGWGEASPLAEMPAGLGTASMGRNIDRAERGALIDPFAPLSRHCFAIYSHHDRRGS